MKKFLSLFFCGLCIFVCASCAHNYSEEMETIYKSENPNMKIMDLWDNDFGSEGEIVYEDGTVQRIVYSGLEGRFKIFKYDEEGNYGLDENGILYSGSYKEKSDKIILTTEKGEEIVLKKVSQNIENELDKSCEEELSKALNVKLRTPIYEKYSALWSEKIDLYYQFIINNYSGSKETIIASQKEWSEYATQQLSSYKEYLDIVHYEKETTVNYYYSKKEYEIYRSRALELYTQCVHLTAKVPDI